MWENGVHIYGTLRVYNNFPLIPNSLFSLTFLLRLDWLIWISIYKTFYQAYHNMFIKYYNWDQSYYYMFIKYYNWDQSYY